MNIYLNAAAVVLLLASGFFAYQYLAHREAEGCDWKKLLTPKFAEMPIYVMSVASLLALGILFYCQYVGQDGFVRAFMNAEVFLWLTLLGYVDLKEKIIPNHLVVVGLLFWVVLALLDVFVAKTYWKNMLKVSLMGGLLVGGVMFIIALIVKSALGMGDVKMFFVIGLFYGAIDTYSILLFSMIVMAVVSLVLLAAKKVSTKTAIPMAPFVVVGYILSILAGL